MYMIVVESFGLISIFLFKVCQFIVVGQKVYGYANRIGCQSGICILVFVFCLDF